MAKFSVIVPVYNEEVYIEDFFANLKKSVLSTKDFEIIFVNDNSTDFSTRILQKIANENSFVKVITLAKNYGKQIAITAAMSYASGDAVVIIPIKSSKPYLAIEKLIHKWQAGNSIVFAYKNERKNFIKTYYKKFKKRIWQFLMRFFGVSGKIYDKPEAELYDRQVIDILNALPDKNLYLRRADSLVGYKKADVFYSFEKDSLEKIEHYKKVKIDLIAKRIEENLPEPKKIKKRLYEGCLWASFGFFSFAALNMLAIAFFYIDKNLGALLYLLILLEVVSLSLSFIFYAKSIIIKRFGILHKLKRDAKLYEIKDLQNF